MGKLLYTSLISGIVLLMNGSMATAQQSTPGGSNTEPPPVLDIVAHRPGTLNARNAQGGGDPVPANEGGPGTPFGYEAILMQNADRQWEAAANPPQNYKLGKERDCDKSNPDGNAKPDLTAYRKQNDSDLVKIELKIKLNTHATGSSLKLTVQKMTVNPTKPASDPLAVKVEGDATGSEMNFYKADGTRITAPLTDLKVDDCKNPGSSYLAGLLSATKDQDGWRTLVLFVEGQARFGSRGDGTGKNYYANTLLGGARMKLEYSVNESPTAEKKLLLYKGGFLIFRQPANLPGTNGTLEFWSGKGRVKHNWAKHPNEFIGVGTDTITDEGVKIGQGWTAKSGHQVGHGGSTNYWTTRLNGHLPPGWWSVAGGEREDRGEGYDDYWENGVLVQGYYTRWPKDDLAPGHAQQYIDRYFYAPVFTPQKNKDALIGPPPPKISPKQNYRDPYCNFKFDMTPLKGDNPGATPNKTAQDRDQIQIHPDGMCEQVDANGQPTKNVGTGGCIGIQTYEDCLRVHDFLLRYHGLKVKVVAE
jgi:hypothetical protein